ncbi:hypothetical protein E4634_06640 [Mangrovimicrobium sediminis]|uniref:Uncharacterized protein n=1 Tax=Mangrovimicrobium sediminis TaxID=2562682 RepID=A0A4Z0M610_9GAMM|nr:YeeE/YedE thiosulfate transporter family protein [Haliea sp. SAOS-164]TGD74866.1 hypothetical protein E4634_06640 [Haliea sp. SAOS-164]
MIDTYFPLGMQHYLAGGLLIGLAVSALYLGTGLVGGMSSVFSTVWSWFSRCPGFQREDFLRSRNWRLLFAAGLVLGAALWRYGLGNPVPVTEIPVPYLLIGGFIAGFGARLGNGCTSGHGICGVASLNLLSLLAVLVFLGVAIITAQLVRGLGL